jgi:hypothetical protein
VDHLIEVGTVLLRTETETAIEIGIGDVVIAIETAIRIDDRLLSVDVTVPPWVSWAVIRIVTDSRDEVEADHRLRAVAEDGRHSTKTRRNCTPSSRVVS